MLSPCRRRALSMADELTILIIEDDKYISNFMSVSLKNEGYKVMLAQSADEPHPVKWTMK